MGNKIIPFSTEPPTNYLYVLGESRKRRKKEKVGSKEGISERHFGHLISMQ